MASRLRWHACESFGSPPTPSATLFSDADGGFEFRAPRRGTYRLAVERLGHGVWQSEPFELKAEQAVSVVFDVPIQPILLQPLTASGDPQCPAPREPARLASVAERTIAALREVVATDTSGLTFTSRWVQYRFTRPTIEDPPRTKYWNMDTAVVQLDRPVPPQDPIEHSRNGYIRFTTLAAVPSYFLPSADVVVSPAFLESHCFGVRVHDDSTWIGLSFEPFRDSENQDVRGVIWVDSLSAQAQRIDFQYTRIEEYVWKWEVMRYNRLQEMHHPPLKYWPGSITFDDLDQMGGNIEFAVTASGHPFTRRWEMRWPMPLIPIAALADEPETTSRTYTVRWIAGYRLHGLTSAEVLRAERNGQQEWPPRQ